jgi:hypothetical protein
MKKRGISWAAVLRSLGDQSHNCQSVHIMMPLHIFHHIQKKLDSGDQNLQVTWYSLYARRAGSNRLVIKTPQSRFGISAYQNPQTCDLESKDQIIAFKGVEPNLRGQNPLNLWNWLQRGANAGGSWTICNYLWASSQLVQTTNTWARAIRIRGRSYYLTSLLKPRMNPSSEGHLQNWPRIFTTSQKRLLPREE